MDKKEIANFLELEIRTLYNWEKTRPRLYNFLIENFSKDNEKNMNLGQKIKLFRSKKGWTQADLAKFSGVSLPNIKRYETGQEIKSTENLQKIASAFDKNLSEFINDKNSLVQNSAEIQFKNLIELFKKLTEKEQKFYLLDMETRILKRELEKEQ